MAIRGTRCNLVQRLTKMDAQWALIDLTLSSSVRVGG